MTAAAPALTDALRERLRGLVRERGLSLRTVAAGAGVHASTVSRFLRGGSLDSGSLDRLAAWVDTRDRAGGA